MLVLAKVDEPTKLHDLLTDAMLSVLAATGAALALLARSARVTEIAATVGAVIDLDLPGKPWRRRP